MSRSVLFDIPTSFQFSERNIFIARHISIAMIIPSRARPSLAARAALNHGKRAARLAKFTWGGAFSVDVARRAKSLTNLRGIQRQIHLGHMVCTGVLQLQRASLDIQHALPRHRSAAFHR